MYSGKRQFFDLSRLACDFFGVVIWGDSSIKEGEGDSFSSACVRIFNFVNHFNALASLVLIALSIEKPSKRLIGFIVLSFNYAYI